MSYATLPATTSPDVWIPITEISGKLLARTGDPGPGYRRLLVGCADSQIAPPMEKRSGRWGCWASKLPELEMRLGLAPKTVPAATTRRQRRGAVPAGQAAAA